MAAVRTSATVRRDDFAVNFSQPSLCCSLLSLLLHCCIIFFSFHLLILSCLFVCSSCSLPLILIVRLVASLHIIRTNQLIQICTPDSRYISIFVAIDRELSRRSIRDRERILHAYGHM